MPTIIALNPRKKKRAKAVASKKSPKRKKRSVKRTVYKSVSAKKKVRKKRAAAPAKRNTKKRGVSMARRKRTYKPRVRRRRNPAPKRKSRARSYSRSTFAGINIAGAAKSSVPLVFGALAAKFVAKKFAEGGAEGDNWTWKNYMLALLGGFVAAAGTSSILKTRKSAQKVMEGAFLLVAYKFFTNEIAPKNESLEAWFSGDDFDPYSGVGDVWQGGEEDFVKGIDGYWRPTSESHRIPQRTSYGDVMVSPDSRYGDVMVSPDSRYGFTQTDAAKSFEQDGM